LAEYVSAGFAPDGFWRLTLREYVCLMDGAGRRIKREHHARMHHALTVATLGRAKKMPRLAELTGEPRSAQKQSASDMLAIVMRWDQKINKG
jgi:hypothetical protein